MQLEGERRGGAGSGKGRGCGCRAQSPLPPPPSGVSRGLRLHLLCRRELRSLPRPGGRRDAGGGGGWWRGPR